MMYTISDWLECHALDESSVSFMLAGSASDGLKDQPEWFSEVQPDGDPFALRFSDQTVCFESMVRPAFLRFFGADEDVAAALDDIEFGQPDPGAEALPYTLDRGPEAPPLVVIDWTGSPQSLLCLAHETAHAVQNLLSRHAFMPPVAREVCACLGELILIDWARAVEPEIAGVLVAVWEVEAERYLGDDADRLSDALSDGDAAYHYRWNYPLARLLAVEAFATQSPEDIRDLFQSAGAAMGRLPVAVLADRARDVLNDLPALPELATDGSEDGFHRSLGAMTLLDMDADQGPADEPVGAYYAARKTEIEAGEVFLALTQDRRPMGYAVFTASGAGDTVAIRHRTLPYCSQTALDQALAAHLAASAKAPESAA